MCCRRACPRKTIFPRRICRLAHRLRGQARSYNGMEALPQCIRGLAPRSPASRLLQILRTPKVGGVSQIAGFCVRERSPVLHRSHVGARLPAKAILPQCIRGLADRVRQQAGSYRFCARRRSAVLAGFCVRQTLPVLHRSPVGARLPAKAILPQRIRGLAHRVRQQAGSYRFCVRRRFPISPDSTDVAYAKGRRYRPD